MELESGIHDIIKFRTKICFDWIFYMTLTTAYYTVQGSLNAKMSVTF